MTLSREPFLASELTALQVNRCAWALHRATMAQPCGIPAATDVAKNTVPHLSDCRATIGRQGVVRHVYFIETVRHFLDETSAERSLGRSAERMVDADLFSSSSRVIGLEVG
jgi:hypothetical protein